MSADEGQAVHQYQVSGMITITYEGSRKKNIVLVARSLRGGRSSLATKKKFEDL